MTLQEIKFLRLIHNLTSKTEQAFYYDEFNCSMHLYENSSVELPCKELSTEIISLESSLAERGYILLLPSQGLNDHNYRLTQKRTPLLSIFFKCFDVISF